MSTLVSNRIFKTKFEQTWFDGEGSFLFGGRWNSPGNRVLYTSSSVALALLEVLVHLDTNELLPAYSKSTVTFDESLVDDVRKLSSLPPNWGEARVSEELQAIGDEWISSQISVILKVPSIVVRNESNYLINVSHPDIAKLKFDQPESFVIDHRLMKLK